MHQGVGATNALLLSKVSAVAMISHMLITVGHINFISPGEGIYCHVPTGRGLHKTALAPGREETWAVNPLVRKALTKHRQTDKPLK